MSCHQLSDPPREEPDKPRGSASTKNSDDSTGDPGSCVSSCLRSLRSSQSEIVGFLVNNESSSEDRVRSIEIQVAIGEIDDRGCARLSLDVSEISVMTNRSVWSTVSHSTRIEVRACSDTTIGEISLLVNVETVSSGWQTVDCSVQPNSVGLLREIDCTNDNSGHLTSCGLEENDSTFHHSSLLCQTRRYC